MDSKLVVEQMSGRWQIKHPDMKPLALQAKSLARQFERVTFAWIPREQNKHADRLANEAMDDAAAGRTWSRRVIVRRAPTRRSRSRPRRPVAGGRSASLEPPTTMVLLRHGETRLSVEKRFSGPTSEPLTARGRRRPRRPPNGSRCARRPRSRRSSARRSRVRWRRPRRSAVGARPGRRRRRRPARDRLR